MSRFDGYYDEAGGCERYYVDYICQCWTGEWATGKRGHAELSLHPSFIDIKVFDHAVSSLISSSVCVLVRRTHEEEKMTITPVISIVLVERFEGTAELSEEESGDMGLETTNVFSQGRGPKRPCVLPHGIDA
ncbi:hypothetical protein PQX77_017247 [Marasmius sp. AFHP31]|nr:hypothetical protein PQX77_017247 [Marasmius sp. AFHP31]